MTKPRILVTSAAGTTGFPVALQLLEKAYPVRAFVRRRDVRSQKLEALGAEVFIGNLADSALLSKAMTGIQRAYFCAPWSPNMLHYGTAFALAAQEARLEVVVAMSQWLSDAQHHSAATRAHWLIDGVLRWMPNVDVITINPGFFADNYMLLLEPIAQLGILPLPLGDGLNAPPSNEDIARVIVGALTDPLRHIGKTYRPTGPRLLSPEDIAGTFAKVLDRPVRYFANVPDWMLPKAMSVFGLDSFTQAQVRHYVREYQRNAFGIGAPTDAVRSVGGREPEDFETITCRAVAERPESRHTFGNKIKALANFMRIPFTPVEDLDRMQASWAPVVQSRYAVDSSTWLEGHGGHQTAGSTAPVGDSSSSRSA